MEGISIISWNICRSISEKLDSRDFVNIVHIYDVVCLYECWVEKDEVVELEGFESYVFPRMHGRGGGIVIFIRSSISEHCGIIDNINDNIVLLKLSRKLSNDDTDTYVFACYFPPVNSTFYDKCENDLFASLGEMVCQYKGIGKVLVLGDFNSRTGSNDDYISNDIINEESADMISNVVNYVPDSEPCKRSSSDPVINQFGRQLISLCKTTALRIVNGRHKDDPNGSITFFNSRGTSLIDYVLTFDDNFNNIRQFESGVSNVVSDHSPVCITLS